MSEQTHNTEVSEALATLTEIAKANLRRDEEAARTKKVSIGEYTRRMNKGRSKLTRPCVENGLAYNAAVMSNKEIDLLNRITRSGRYIDRRVEVILREPGDGVSEESVEIRFDNRRDQVSELKGYVRNTEDMLRQIVEAQDEENRLDAEQSDQRKRKRA